MSPFLARRVRAAVILGESAVRGEAAVRRTQSCANRLRAPAARSQNSPSVCSSGVHEALRDHAAALGKLGHDLFMEPDIHLSRAVEAAFVGELLRKLLAGGET